jgi:hypothetical protein
MPIPIDRLVRSRRKIIALIVGADGSKKNDPMPLCIGSVNFDKRLLHSQGREFVDAGQFCCGFEIFLSKRLADIIELHRVSYG